MKIRAFITTILALMIFASLCFAEEEITFSGNVLDPNGNPVERAKVTVFAMQFSSTAKTFDQKQLAETLSNDEGAFEIKTVKSPNQQAMGMIIVDAESFAIGFVNWHMRSDQQSDIKLTKPQRIEGVIVNDHNEPIGGARVQIFMMAPQYAWLFLQSDHPMLTRSTDEQGRFYYDRIPENVSAEFIVEKEGFAKLSTFDPSQGSPQFKYQPGQTDIQLMLEPEAILEGKVVEKGTENPVAGAAVFVYGDDDDNPFTSERTVADESGNFRLNGLSSGEIKVVLVKSDDSNWLSEPQKVTVSSGQTENISIEAQQALPVKIIVKDTQNDFVDHAYVHVNSAQDRSGVQEQTDGNGVAVFQLLAGDYEVVYIRKNNELHHNERYPFTVESSKDNTITVEVQGMPKLALTVKDKDGQPVEGAQLMVLPRSGGIGNDKTDADGKAELKWNPRPWGNQKDIICYLIIRHPEKNLAYAQPISEDDTQLDITLKDGVIVTGKVTDVNDNPLTDAKIRISFSSGRWSTGMGNWQKGDAQSDANGIFEFNALPPGNEYYINAVADGFGRQQQKITTADASSNPQDLGTFTLKPANMSISGVVLDPDDQPVANARLNIYGDSQPDNLHDIRTDEKGRFEVNGVCEGDLRINIWTQTSPQMHGNARVMGGEKDITLYVTPSGSRGRGIEEPKGLQGKSLPDLASVGLDPNQLGIDGKAVLVCLWDYQQRPSRHIVKQLAGKADALKAKSIDLILVDTSKTEPDAVSAFLQKNNLQVPCGKITGDIEKALFSWGAKGLPWLILTDPNHTVIGEGIKVEEIEK